MIPPLIFERMLALAKSVGADGRPMPNFGSLRAIAPDQMIRLNDVYNDARNTHAAKRK